jgi:phenylpropionate dioxygenase-like ring-hydroxylating dioxygenase large terminal subunit
MTSFATNPALRHYWHVVARSSAVTTEPVAVRLLGEDLVVWRAADGGIGALADRCAHRESPLSPGKVKAGCIECPYHGWHYDASGACVLVPSARVGAPIPPKARVPAVHATERYGLLWLCLDEPVAGVPEISQAADPAYRRINSDVNVWHTATTRMVDNFLDITHFPYVHVGSFGSAAQTEVPHFELGDLGDWYGYRYSVTAANPAAAAAASGQATATVQRFMSSGFALPFAVRSTIEYETGLEHVLLLLSTPRDDETSYFTVVVWRNDDFSVPADEVTHLDRLIEAEDKQMLERIRGTLPLDNTALVSVQSDKASVEWRRQLRALLA